MNMLAASLYTDTLHCRCRYMDVWLIWWKNAMYYTVISSSTDGAVAEQISAMGYEVWTALVLVLCTNQPPVRMFLRIFVTRSVCAWCLPITWGLSTRCYRCVTLQCACLINIWLIDRHTSSDPWWMQPWSSSTRCMCCSQGKRSRSAR